MRALIVDDDAAICNVLQSDLQLLGYVSTCATDGKCAKQKLDELGHELNLIVIDVNMPDMDGVELLAHVREIGVKCAILVISSSKCNAGVVALARAYGLNVLDFAQKPLHSTRLAAILLEVTVPDDNTVAGFRAQQLCA